MQMAGLSFFRQEEVKGMGEGPFPHLVVFAPKGLTSLLYLVIYSRRVVLCNPSLS